MNESTHKRMHAIVVGEVQGVGFRYFVHEVANSLPITGWVRNRRDGSVEVLAEGTPQSLGMLLHALKEGPRSARVYEVREEWTEAIGEFTSFWVGQTRE